VDYKKQDGREFLAMDSLEELSALKTIMNAFGRFTHARGSLLYRPATRDLIMSTNDVVSRAEHRMTQIRDEVRKDVADTQQFKPPYIKPILAAVATFEQRPELLEPHMTAAQFKNTQVFFPPEASEAATA
jgi:hypothetical protein